MKKKILLAATLMMILCLAALMSLSAYAEDTLVLPEGEAVSAGYCGTSNLAWEIHNSATAGKYDLYFYIDAESENAASTTIENKNASGGKLTDNEWSAYKANFDRVLIGDGITKIGIEAFLGFSMAFVEFPENAMTLNDSAFRACTSLKAINVRGKSYSGNVADLSTVIWMGTRVFESCTSVAEYILPSINIQYGKEFYGNNSLKSITLGSYLYHQRPFGDCKALEEIVVKGQPTFTGANAFLGCSAIKTVKFLDPDFRPSASGWLDADVIPNITFVCMGDEQAEYVKTTFATDKVEVVKIVEPLRLDGFKVRTEGYNGLRSIFVFDEIMNDEKEKQGYTLVEYGAIVASKATFDRLGGLTVKLDDSTGEYVTGDDLAIKVAIVSDGAYKGKVLEQTDTQTTFALTVTNFPKTNYAADVCYVGYTVYSKDGETEIVYCKAPAAYESVDLYQMTLNMFTGALLNSADDKDGILWDVLESGVAEFTPGSDYTYLEGMTDIKGVQDFSQSFKVKDIPVVTWATSGDVTTFTQSGDVTVTLLNDPSDSSYVAVYRSESGTGVIPASDPAVKPQLVTGSQYPNYAGETPMPKLSVDITNNIKTVILDNGITGIANYGFTHMEKCKKYVYSSTLATIGEAAFYCNRVVSTMACTGNGVVENVIDLGSVAEMNTNYAFEGVNNSAATKIILPVKCTSGQDWKNNVGHNFGKSFGNTLKCIVVPDGCALFTSQALTFSNFTDLKIIQKTYNADMAASITARGGMVYYQNETTPW